MAWFGVARTFCWELFKLVVLCAVHCQSRPALLRE